jgi:3-oxoacyl-[acyl-carrier-protein] synthase II
MQRRVVITGLGVVSPVGKGKEEFWSALLGGVSGISPISSFDSSDYPCKIAAEIKDFDPSSFVDKKEVKRMDRFVQFAAVASLMAVQDAQLTISADNSGDVGVVIGSGIGGILTWESQHSLLIERGPSRVSPFFVPMMISNMASGHVSMLLSAKGPNTTTVTACASGAHAIGDAFQIIRRGEAQVMIAGGAEAAISPLSMAGFCSLKALSTRNDEPERASRPFDKLRDGFIMGEGSGIVVLEEMNAALARKANIYAEIVGYGMSADAYHMTAPCPDGSGAARAMRAALNNAGIAPDQVDYINAHGTSTPLNDAIETMAIKTVFGEYAPRLAVSSTKSMTGHLLGAAGGVEFIACALACRDSVVPPTTNYEVPDPDCDLDYVPNKRRQMRVGFALSNSFGFGGQNAALLVKKWEPTA